MIWLVDYTHYEKEIDKELLECKRDYFRIKSYKRYNIIGKTAPVKTKVYSTGLLRIATLLSRSGIEVRYLHYYMLEELLEQGATPPEVVAFSCVCPTVPMCAELAERIKSLSPGTKVLLGGVHVNVAEEETRLRYPIFDRLIVGYELEAAEKIAGRRLNNQGEGYVDYSLLPYHISDYAINTFTNMGCPFSCKYCVDGLAPHFTASENGQLDRLKQLLPSRNLVHFFDSVLGYSKEGIARVCRAIESCNHDLILSCDMRADILTPELVRALYKAGFREIRLGMESSNEELLSGNGRTLSFSTFRGQLELIRESSDMYVTLYTITGLPGTTPTIQQATLEECDRLFSLGLVDEIKNALYVPYPMKNVNYAERGIQITSTDWRGYDRQSYPVYRTPEMSEDELWRMYIDTARTINNSWLKSIGYSRFTDVPEIPDYYSEYVEAKYMKK
ncbi:MAG: cobalamin-dependent protein [Clostridia bacterium]|nr:cobalamin-dependent protein [Clostridia bacterium]